nr:MAG TPA: hypothetical protein [Caudoviricetes sp.]
MDHLNYHYPPSKNPKPHKPHNRANQKTEQK